MNEFPGGQPPSPSGCHWCGVEGREHMQRWKPPVGWHTWQRPTQSEALARMRARRAADVRRRAAGNVDGEAL